MEEQIKARIEQLRDERQALAARLAELRAEIDRGEHLLSAYDGAIGELSQLVPPDGKTME